MKMVPVSSTFVLAVILAESSTSHFRMTRLLFLPSAYAVIFAVLEKKHDEKRDHNVRP